MKYIYTRRRCLMLVFPMLALYCLFTMWPMIQCLYFSFCSYRGLGQPKWNNFANYTRLLRDRYLINSLKNTGVVAISMLLFLMPLSFIISYSIRKTSMRNTVYRTIVFAPYVVPGTLTGLLWYFLLNPSFGMFNAVLNAVGLPGVQWIGGMTLSPVSYALACTWSNMGFYVCLWNVALKSISSEVLEAGLIDGCTGWQQISKIILPILKENIGSMCILILTSALKVYEMVYVLTGGGPNRASETIISYMYSTTFDGQTYGYGMTIGMVQFVLAVCITLISLSLTRKNKED